MKLEQLAREIGAELIGDGSIDITSANTLEDARPGQISFLTNAKYARQFETTQASAVIAAPGASSDRLAVLISKEPHFAFTRAMEILHGHRKHPFRGVHPQALVDESASIGEGTVVYPGAYVGAGTKVGRDCIIYPNVVIYDQCVIGDRVIIHGGTVIGADGFGFATVRGVHHKVPQVGNVVIEDDVEIGANCNIARAALGSTVIGKGSKFDALVAVGHNTKLGPGGLVVALVGIAGSATIGHHATIGGQAGIVGHIKIGDNVTIGGKAGVTNDVADESVILGSPAMPVARARRVFILYTQLPEMLERIKELEEQMGELASEGEE